MFQVDNYFCDFFFKLTIKLLEIQNMMQKDPKTKLCIPHNRNLKSVDFDEKCFNKQLVIVKNYCWSLTRLTDEHVSVHAGGFFKDLDIK